MAFDQTKDVLEHARKFHHSLAEFYDKLKESTSKERVKILLDYMSRHQQHLDENLALFTEDVSRNILDTYFKYGSEAIEVSTINDFEIKPDMDVDDVVAAAIHFDACLVQFYREMAQHSVSEKVREVFENLLELEQREQVELSKKTLELC